MMFILRDILNFNFKIFSWVYAGVDRLDWSHSVPIDHLNNCYNPSGLLQPLSALRV